jgi:hypothetical protein
MAVGQGYDWGERSERWAEVISEVADVGGIRVHYAPRSADPFPAERPAISLPYIDEGPPSMKWIVPGPTRRERCV